MDDDMWFYSLFLVNSGGAVTVSFIGSMSTSGGGPSAYRGVDCTMK